MRPDSEGFLFPTVDAKECTDCGLCDRICPIPKEKDPATRTKGEPLEVLASWHLDPEIRRQSSSGGVFTALADAIFAQGGVVVGAAFDEHLVVKHVIIESPSDLHRLRGSKYVQSEISSAVYHAIREHLRSGRVVLFTGVPCQVAGMKDFFRKPYPNLYTCDLICHGVPSPLFWEKYLDYCQVDSARPSHVSFRDKTTGWKRYSVTRTYPSRAPQSATLHHDPYMQAFLANINLRESCYLCEFCTTARQGDITVADFWGVRKKYPQHDPEDKGTTLLLINTEHGVQLIEQAKPRTFSAVADLKTAIAGNRNLHQPTVRPPFRHHFYENFDAPPGAVIARATKHSLPVGVLGFLRRVYRSLKALVQR